MASILIVQGVHRIAEPLFKMTLSFPFWAKIPAGFFLAQEKKRLGRCSEGGRIQKPSGNAAIWNLDMS